MSKKLTPFCRCVHLFVVDRLGFELSLPLRPGRGVARNLCRRSIQEQSAQQLLRWKPPEYFHIFHRWSQWIVWIPTVASGRNFWHGKQVIHCHLETNFRPSKFQKQSSGLFSISVLRIIVFFKFQHISWFIFRLFFSLFEYFAIFCDKYGL